MQIRGLETKRHAREISVQRMTAKFALMGAVRRLRRGDPATVTPAMTGDETMTRTFFAALIALTATSGLAAAQLSAKANIDSDVVIVDATSTRDRTFSTRSATRHPARSSIRFATVRHTFRSTRSARWRLEAALTTGPSHTQARRRRRATLGPAQYRRRSKQYSTLWGTDDRSR